MWKKGRVLSSIALYARGYRESSLGWIVQIVQSLVRWYLHFERMAFLGFPYRRLHILEMAEFRQRDNCALIEKPTEGLNKNASLTQPIITTITPTTYIHFLSPAPLDRIAQHDCLSWKSTATSFTWRHKECNREWGCEWCGYTTQSRDEDYEFERCSRGSARLSSTNLFPGKRVPQALMVY